MHPLGEDALHRRLQADLAAHRVDLRRAGAIQLEALDAAPEQLAHRQRHLLGHVELGVYRRQVRRQQGRWRDLRGQVGNPVLLVSDACAQRPERADHHDVVMALRRDVLVDRLDHPGDGLPEHAEGRLGVPQARIAHGPAVGQFVAQRDERDAVLLHRVAKHRDGAEAHAVPAQFQGPGQADEGKYVAGRADGDEDGVHGATPCVMQPQSPARPGLRRSRVQA